MRIPISWLKEYVDVKISAKELSDKLTMSGTENEILQAEKGSFEGFVVGEILEITKHPNADKLQVTKTSVGKESLQIVCGAPNIEVGQKVPVALIGTQIGEFEIKEADLRGVKSFGMLCSEAELGISDDHSGIMILDPRSKVGDKLSNALNTGDTVLEAELTSNRGDCLSMLGIAGDVSVITGQKMKMPVIKIQESKEKASDLLSVEIKDKSICRRYIGRIIKNVKIGPSPKWMQDRLSASGVRPINNVVDVTNYVMLEMGQPLHAFDADKIANGKIIVRSASNGEKIKTLDGVIRELNKNDLVIADNKEAVAVAGVMGGASSEVTDKTKTIVLESANFDPAQVRKTALRLALRSESSTRFEKGLPLILAEQAVNRAASLLNEVAGGEVLSGMVDVGEKKDKDRKITLKFAQVKLFLGEDIPANKAVTILKALGFKVLSKNKEGAEFLVPYWRLDVSIEEDLLEEIARIYGYANIPSTLPEGKLPLYEKNRKIEISKKVRGVLTALGFFEVYSYSFTSKERAGLYRSNVDLVHISNPLSQEQEYMRADLVGSFMDIVSKNKEYSAEIKVYEIASIYNSKTEVTKLSGLISTKTSGDMRGRGEIIHNAIGAVNQLFKSLGVKKVDIEFSQGNDIFSQIGQIKVQGKDIGWIGFIIEGDRKITAKSRDNAFFELDIVALNDVTQPKKFHNISKFPSSARDLTFIFDEAVIVAEIKKVISSVLSGIRLQTQILDNIYRGKGLPEGKKSVSIRFTYQSDKRTLTDKEVDDDQAAIIKKIKDVLGGTLRGGREKE